MTIQLPELPYTPAALEPHMSARTLEFHHGKHHKAYVDNTNAAIAGTALEQSELDAIVRAAKERGDARLFNNAAQAWNHEFFWNSLAPGGGAPEGMSATMIDRDFGGIEGFKTAFRSEATGHFASGWAWLVLRGDKLAVTSYHDADSPLIHDGVVPLLTCDVWEHAYYLDYQNARARFVDAFLDHLLNWEWVGANLRKALVAGDRA